MIRFLFRLFILLLLLAPFGVFAETITLLEGINQFVPAGKNLQFFEDRGGNIPVEQMVSDPDRYEYQWLSPDRKNFGFTSSVYWFRFRVQNLDERNPMWYLEIAYPPLDHIEIYRRGESRPFSVIGDMLPGRGEDSLRFGEFVVRLDLEPFKEEEFFVRVKTESSLVFPMTLWNPNAMAEHVQKRSIGISLYYGIMLAMIFYNLFLFVSLKDITYLFYVLFSSSILFYVLLLNGIATVYLWPGHPLWNEFSYVFFASMAIFFALLFIRKFLLLHLHNRSFNRITLILAGFAVITNVLYFALPFGIVIRMVGVTGMVAGLLGFFMAAHAYYHGFRPARYFLISWGFFLSGVFATVFRNFGFVPSNIISDFGFQFGSAMEVLLLSLGLAYRIKILRLENERERALNLARNDFIVGLGHELHRPLEQLLGSVELLKDTTLDQEQVRYLTILKKGAREVDRVARDILDLDAVEKGTLIIRRERFYTQEFLDRSLQIFQEAAFTNRIRLSWSVRPGVPAFLFGDPIRLGQIINSITNYLIRMTESACEIHVDLAPSAEKMTGDRLKTGWFEIRIFETAGGLTLEHRARFFDQLKHRGRGPQQGAALGLSIAGRLIRLLGGRIFLEEDNRLGFSVRLAFPFELDGTMAPVGINRTDDASDEPGKIIVAASSQEDREMIQFFLKKTGLRVDEAGDTFQLRELFQRYSYDWIIVDLSLPGDEIFRIMENLRSVAEKRRNRDGEKELRIIAIGSANTERERAQAMDAGCDFYLSRPLTGEAVQSLF